MRNQNLAAKRTITGIAGVLALVSARGAEAADATSSLAWVRLEGAETCIGANALARAVEERLGRAVFVSASQADLTVEGAIGPATTSGFRASIRVSDHDGVVIGSREVETLESSCNALDGKLALVVSLLIDPDGAPAPAPVAPPAAPLVIERTVVVPAAPPRVWSFDLTAGIGLTLGLQPGAGVAVAPAVAITPPRLFPIIASAAIAFPSTTDVGAGARVETSTSFADLALCPLAGERGLVRAMACVGGFLGATRGRGVGLDDTRASAGLVGGPSASGRLAFVLAGPLVVAASVEVQIPLAQAEVAYRTGAGDNVAFRTSDVAGHADLMLGVRIP